ncbi:PAS/PAC sensor hybrid histidine kinase [Nocardioides sp. J9]|uniref:hybrid sensor histidine kinase/response regulator n=1 Tax=unclassified Nocardioides TaxID=2615069 RepID=UPI0004B37F7D|nr:MULTISPECIES: PAS domain S-box protein [unclassified Nocardioides]TWG98202.1 PAS/PAC sensor hybrid histidine kinase [Nocardioides sp. J9]
MADRPTVVVIDDAPELRALVGARLRSSGLFEVVGEGGDGGEAMVLAHEHQPDLMLLDTSMPVLDGLEALPLVLAVSPDTKVVVFTGFESRGLAGRAYELGAADFIEKSTPIDQLPDLLWKHVADSVPRPVPRGGGLRIAGGDDERTMRDQAALDEHLERYREVFNQAAIGMATLTLNGSIVRANPELAAMVGRTPEDLVGLDYGVLTRQHGDQLDDALVRIIEQGEGLATFEHPLVYEDGTSTALRVSLTPIRDSHGAPLYVFAQVLDITAEVELRRSEEMFRLLVTTVSDYAIYMLDTTGRVASWNAGAQRIKGYTSEEILGQHYRVFYPEEERALGKPERNLEIALEEGSYTAEAWRVRRDGTRFWANVMINPIHDDAGQLRGFAKLTRDQSEERVREEQRRQAIEQQAGLLAVTAHELRTPAAVVEGAAAMLRRHDEMDPAERLQLLEAMVSSARRLQRLASDLKAASDMHVDALTLQPERMWLRGTLLAAVDRARAMHPHDGVAVHVDQDVEFTADPARVGQALDNLLSNAVNHGRAPVVVTGERTESGVRISVADSGHGVDQRLEPRLFQRYAHAGPNAGSGIGLDLVREIARSHGGEATYLPPGQDRMTTFVIDLPSQPTLPRL